MIFSLPENDIQRTLLVNALGRKWEFTFTTLITFGGAFFASFPLFYSTSFGGAYWVWTAILFSFIIQAIAYEFRSKPKNVIGKRTFDLFLFLNGAIGPFLIGVAVATFFTGSRFSLNNMNQVKWATPFYGLEALMNFRNIALGFAVLFLTRVNALLYIFNTIDDEELLKRTGKALILNSIIFVVFFLVFVIILLVSKGFSADPASGQIEMVKYKYLKNFVQMPVVLIIFLAGVAGVLYGIGASLKNKNPKGIWFAGSGTVMAVLSLFLIAGFNSTSFYPSLYDLQSSLTIRNASSSLFTLKAMMFVSFLIPFIFAYIWYAWKSINDRRINEQEMKSDGHVY
jgi:cytochrome d ubiquinol oxidase subunit II